MKALRFILLALALLVQGGGAFVLEATEPPASCCCEDRCPCPMPPPTPRAPQAPTALQAPLAQAPAQAVPARAPRVEPRPWAGLPESRDAFREPSLAPAPRPEPDPPGGRDLLSRNATLRI
ncbi:MAG TPA: hypothetical protein VJ570_06875 [Holophagaceae bacterium]|nr:hypothetical protein [Holophagaceae bacterium]